MKKYAQLKTLCEIFDLSEDYFVTRMESEKRPNAPFRKGVHFFIPEESSKTKKAILWDIQAVENWIRGHHVDNELENFLKRTALPSITGLAASGPIFPSPSTAVPFEMTATRFPFDVYL